MHEEVTVYNRRMLGFVFFAMYFSKITKGYKSPTGGECRHLKVMHRAAGKQ